MNCVLDQSIMYFVINRCSFSGAILSGGFSSESSQKRFTPTSIDRIENLDLTYFDIYNHDFEDFINNNRDNPRNLIFLDPPYYLEKGSKLMVTMVICMNHLTMINYTKLCQIPIIS